MNDHEDIVDRLIGSMYGFIVGDALGTGYQQEDNQIPANIPVLIKFKENDYLGTKPGAFSDATSMSLVTMANYLDYEDGEKVELDEFFKLLQDWYIGGDFTPNGFSFSCDPVTVEAIKRQSNGMPCDRCGDKGQLGTTYGALKRIIPVIMFNIHLPTKDLVKEISLFSTLTHNTKESTICCMSFGILLQSMIMGTKKKLFDTLELCIDSLYNSNTDWIDAINTFKENKKNNHNGTLEAVDVFWKSWEAFCQGNGTFNEVMRNAILSENPATTGALAGALAGASLGINKIPRPLIKQLQLSEYLTQIISQFIVRVTKRIETIFKKETYTWD